MTDRPNIVLILSDQHNARLMGCAGHAVVRTPNLDALAAGGVMFDAAYCPHPLCVPSRIGLMTGMYPSRIGAVSNGSTLDSCQATFAHALGACGYEAVLCGRMHFEGPDQFHGFERRLVGDCTYSLTREIEGQGYNRTNGQTRYAVEVAGHGATGFQAYDREVTDRACDFLGGRAASERPFCLVVGLMLPHNPLIARKDLFDEYFSRLPVPPPVSEDFLRRLHPAVRAWRKRRGVDELTPRQHHRALAAYCALVTELDENVGRLVASVRASAMAGKTIVMYASDHGDQAGEQGGMWWKSSHYEGSARVPLIASWPGHFPAGRRVPAPVSLIDVGPTVLDLAGCPDLGEVDGRSLRGMLEKGDRQVFADRASSGSALASDAKTSQAPFPSQSPFSGEVFCEYLGDHGDKPSCMIRRGPWKLIYYSEFDSYQLFDLSVDPGETTDLAAMDEHRPLAADLLARIHRRWSAQDMMRHAARQRQSWRLIHACGHDFLPHAVEHPRPRPEDNRFDFRQLPASQR